MTSPRNPHFRKGLLSGLHAALAMAGPEGTIPLATLASLQDPQAAAETEPADTEYTKTKILERGDGQAIHIPFEPLRQFLNYEILGSRVVPDRHLYEGDDNDNVRARKDREAIYSLSTFVSQVKAMEAQLKKLATLGYDATVQLAYTDLVTMVRGVSQGIIDDAKAAYEKGEVTFSQLSTVLEPGMHIAFLYDKALAVAEVRQCDIQQGFMSTYLMIQGAVYGWDGQAFTPGQHTIYVDSFKGTKSLVELGFEPLTEETKASLIERGHKYASLVRQPSYQLGSGSVVYRRYYGTSRYSAQGRIMVDVAAMAQANPNYNMWFGGIDPRNANQQRRSKRPIGEITDNIALCMSPIAYGFAFASKRWGELLVDEISDVKFRKDAYDKLVLAEKDKEDILALVQRKRGVQADLIDGKGGGCIILLAGPPGLGKTLTAEAVAELLERPLYAVGIGELGTDDKELEENLTRILQTAQEWNAVLLLDEADIFLEMRKDDDIKRNAMVGVFLRLLEYYPGILFLTTNRARRLDDAFHSRISMSLMYPELDEAARRKIWLNNFEQLTFENINVSDEELKKLSGEKLNGRQIKNICRIGYDLAQAKGRPASYDDFLGLISRAKAFEKQGSTNSEKKPAGFAV